MQVCNRPVCEFANEREIVALATIGVDEACAVDLCVANTDTRVSKIEKMKFKARGAESRGSNSSVHDRNTFKAGCRAREDHEGHF